MKKLFILLLLVGTTASAQMKQFRVIYTETFTPTENQEPTWLEGKNVFFFNYNNETKVKLYKANNTAEIYVMVSDMEYGATQSGYKYSGADYVGEKGDEIYIQYFEDPKHGTRIIFNDGKSIEFR